MTAECREASAVAGHRARRPEEGTGEKGRGWYGGGGQTTFAQAALRAPMIIHGVLITARL